MPKAPDFPQQRIPLDAYYRTLKAAGKVSSKKDMADKAGYNYTHLLGVMSGSIELAPKMRAAFLAHFGTPIDPPSQVPPAEQLAALQLKCEEQETTIAQLKEKVISLEQKLKRQTERKTRAL